jgi:hypothetical protein
MEKAGAIVVNATTPFATRIATAWSSVRAQSRGAPSAGLSLPTRTSRAGRLRRVKRCDFHATQTDDVLYAASEVGWRDALSRFAERGIPFVIAQEHVPGD